MSKLGKLIPMSANPTGPPTSQARYVDPVSLLWVTFTVMIPSGSSQWRDWHRPGKSPGWPFVQNAPSHKKEFYFYEFHTLLF